MAAGGIHVALSGAIAQEKLLETTAQNLANASTAGYQRLRPLFKEVLAKGGASAGYHLSSASATRLDVTAGSIEKTGRPLDAALPAGTYLAVQTPRGERYTRASSLRAGKDGFLETTSGLRVLGEGGKPIKLDEGEPVLRAGGEVEVGGEVVGRLRLVSFAAPTALTLEGGSILAATAGSGPATLAKGATLEVGALEQSNAPVVSAMTDLVTAQRSFDAFQRAIDAFREADRRVVTTVPSST